VELIGSGARHNVDIGAAADGELGVCDVRLNVELLDGVRRRSNHPGIGIDLVVEDAVHREVILFAALSVDGRADPPGAQCHDKAALLAVFHRGCSWRQQRQLSELPPVKRQINRFLVIDNIAQGGRSGIQHRRRARDLHSLRRRSHAHLEIQGEALVDLHLDVHLFLLTKAGFLYRDVVNARSQLRHDVVPVRPRGRGPCDTGALVSNGNLRARDDSSGGICHRPGHKPVRGLSRRPEHQGAGQ
jgi:hypothetical protein